MFEGSNLPHWEAIPEVLQNYSGGSAEPPNRLAVVCCDVNWPLARHPTLAQARGPWCHMLSPSWADGCPRKRPSPRLPWSTKKRPGGH
eukprot:364689-Chlamydomonas_euryale.AAC.3